MSTIATPRSSNVRRSAGFALLVLLSLILPLALVGWSVHFAMSGKPLGHPTGRESTFNGPLQPEACRDHVLWFTGRRYIEKAYAAPVAMQIKQMNIQTGEIRDVGAEATDRYYLPLLLDKELYAIGQAIFRKTEGDFQKVADVPERQTSFFSNFFLYEGHLTTVSETEKGQFRLQQFIDGKWIEGRAIRLPRRGSQWRDDPKTGIHLIPPNRPQQTGSSQNQFWLAVIENRGSFHLFVRDLEVGLSAYRNGFDFVDDEQEVASASSPENLASLRSDHDRNGWEPIHPIKNLATSGDRSSNPSPQYDPDFRLGRDDRHWTELRCDHEGPIVVASDLTGRIVRLNQSGHWIDLKGFRAPPDEAYFHRTIIVDQADGAAYLLDQNFQWNTAAIHRIEGTEVGPPLILLKGVFAEYLVRWRNIFFGIVVAWILHLALLISGTTWLLRRCDSHKFSFGQRHVQLASPARRAFAKVIDQLILAGTFVGLVSLQVVLLRIELPSLSEEFLSKHLFAYENAVFWGTRDGWLEFQQQFQSAILSSIEALSSIMRLHKNGVALSALEFLALLGLLAVFEGQFGWTPGKWLLRIQTLRTTLRPCGFVRACLRNTMDWFDFPLLLTPIPALLSMILSPSRQRLGDRLADTLIVDINSNLPKPRQGTE